MSKIHRISLKAQWQVDGRVDPHNTGFVETRARRTFHRPTGVALNQVVRLCFEPASPHFQISLNGRKTSLTSIEGLAIADITGMMEPINRVEITWRGISCETSQLPEHFAVWLEITDDDPGE